VAVTVSVDAGEVRVRFSGLDRFWALSRGLTIPVHRVRSARVLPRREAAKACPKVRMPGSYWPKRLHAGSYGFGEKRQLWCVHRGQEVLAIDLRGRPYARVVVEVGNPKERAGRITAAVAGRAAREPGEP
jgi:hypothetical protein